MTALADQRFDSQNLVDGLIIPNELPCKTGKTFYKGAMVQVEATGGFLLPAGAVATQRTVGVVDTGTQPKVITTGADGLVTLKVLVGIFPFKNSASADLITQADVYKTVYVVDDQTVAKTDNSAARPAAGTVYCLKDGLVWVACGFPFLGR